MEDTRRGFLSTLGLTATTLAGCQSLGSQPESTSETPVSTPETETAQPRTPSPDTATETATATPEPEPEMFRVDFQYVENTELLNELEEISHTDFVEENSINTAETTIVQNHSTEQELDNIPIDLTAQQYHHKNNYLDGEFKWIREMLQAMSDPDRCQDIKYGENGQIYMPYKPPPNSFPTPEFDFQLLKESETLPQLFGRAIRFIGNYDNYKHNDGFSLYSGKNHDYAAAVQETVDRWVEDLDAHIWGYTTDNFTHGLMSGYDANQDEIYILETVKGPKVRGVSTIDPKPIHESPHIDSDSVYWHPVQFHRGEYFDNDFQESKLSTTAFFAGIGGLSTQPPYSSERKGSDLRGVNPDKEETNIAPTTGMMEEMMEAIATYHSNDYDFQEDILQNALTLTKLRDTDRDYVIDLEDYSDQQNMTLVAYDVTNVENNSDFQEGSKEVLQKVWEDREGRYDNFEQVKETYMQNEDLRIEEAARQAS